MLLSSKTKSEIRKEVKSSVKNLSEEQKREKSALIFSQVANLSVLQYAHTIALYASLPDEVFSFDAIESFSTSKRVVLPRVEGSDMEFYPYSPNTLERGAFGIAEPQGTEAIEPAEIDVIIVPGVAFTPDGKRCGRGKGYYDKYLSKPGLRAIKIGICYAEQLVNNIPCEEHDIVMDMVVSG